MLTRNTKTLIASVGMLLVLRESMARRPAQAAA